MTLKEATLLAITGATAAAIAGPAWNIGVELAHRARGPIVQHIAVEVETPIVARGQDLLVRVMYSKIADCPGTWSFSVRWHGQENWNTLGEGHAGTNPPGRYTILHRVTIPPSAPTGPAVWRETTAYICGAWTSVSRSPEAKFTVTQ